MFMLLSMEFEVGEKSWTHQWRWGGKGSESGVIKQRNVGPASSGIDLVIQQIELLYKISIVDLCITWDMYMLGLIFIK